MKVFFWLFFLLLLFFKFVQQEIMGRFLSYLLSPSATQRFWTFIRNRPILIKDMVKNKALLYEPLLVDKISLRLWVPLLSFKITSIVAFHIGCHYFLFKDLSHTGIHTHPKRKLNESGNYVSLIFLILPVIQYIIYGGSSVDVWQMNTEKNMSSSLLILFILEI